MNDLTPTQITEWFRERARLFNQMAQQVESTFKLLPQTDDKTPQLPSMGTVNAEAIRKLVSKKQMRVANLAAHFAVEKWDVLKIVNDPDSGLVCGQRGWISVKK